METLPPRPVVNFQVLLPGFAAPNKNPNACGWGFYFDAVK
jgi:hypothetical protein